MSRAAGERWRQQDVDGFYKLQVEPWLKKQEGRRRATIRRRWLVIGGGFAAAAAALAYLLSRPEIAPVWYVVPASIAGIALFAGVISTGGLNREVKQHLTAKLAAFSGFSYEAKPSRDPVERFRTLGLVPAHNRCSLEDRWWGTADGVAFDLVEADLEDEERERDSDGKDTTTRTTVFRGLLAVFGHHRATAGAVTLRRDLGRVVNWVRAKFTAGEPVKFDDPDFERAFEVFADDPQEARRLLDPGLRKRILGLADGRRLTLAFQGADVLLAIEGDNLFETGSLRRTLVGPERFRRMADDLGIVFQIVEKLELKPSGGGS